MGNPVHIALMQTLGKSEIERKETWTRDGGDEVVEVTYKFDVLPDSPILAFYPDASFIWYSLYGDPNPTSDHIRLVLRDGRTSDFYLIDVPRQQRRIDIRDGDFSSCRFYGLDLQHLDKEGCNFKNAIFVRCVFSNIGFLYFEKSAFLHCGITGLVSWVDEELTDLFNLIQLLKRVRQYRDDSSYYEDFELALRYYTPDEYQSARTANLKNWSDLPSFLEPNWLIPNLLKDEVRQKLNIGPVDPVEVLFAPLGLYLDGYNYCLTWLSSYLPKEEWPNQLPVSEVAMAVYTILHRKAKESFNINL